MRLIGTLHNEKDALNFSLFLNRKSISHQIEISRNTDWGSSDYGSSQARIWIYEEDQTEEAIQWLELFQENPHDPQFNVLKPPPFPTESSSNQDPFTPSSSSTAQISVNEQNRSPKTRSSKPQSPMGIVTRLLLLGCCLIFFVSQLLITGKENQVPTSVAALFLSPVEKVLLYDYPHVYDLIDRFITLYGYDNLQEPKDLPPEGYQLIRQINNTPYWQGLYTILKQEEGESASKELQTVPMFEKIRQGEIWRLISPALLHADLFHLFFNMLWLVVLGRQMEQRLGKAHYIFFILLTAIVSNTAQYIMSGPNFVGLSGVLCGMLTFIWTRQRYAPWEGYQLDKMTIIFMLIFIFAMAALQIFSFVLEKSLDVSISPGIANTAHLSGALIGLVLGRMNFFSWRST